MPAELDSKGAKCKHGFDSKKCPFCKQAAYLAARDKRDKLCPHGKKYPCAQCKRELKRRGRR